MKKLLTSFSLIFSVSIALFSAVIFNENISDSYTGAGGTIGTTNFEYCFTMTVTGLQENLSSDYGLQSVCVDLDHPGLNNIGVKLFSPDGTSSILTQLIATGSALDNTCFSDDATNTIASGTPPYTDIYLPKTPLSSINNGQSGEGTWRICTANLQTNTVSGILNSWTLNFDGDSPTDPPTPSGCPDSVLISAIHTSDTISSSMMLTSTATVPAGAIVQYEAGTEINLNEPFEVEETAIFSAIIQECTSDTTTNENEVEISNGASTLTVTQTIDGTSVDRTVHVKAPATFEDGKQYPLVFAFHGNGGMGSSFLGNQQLNTLIDAGEFIGVYPDGYLNSWNLGAATANEASNADEIYYVGEILSQLGNYSNIDITSAYAIGLSNGAAVINYLGKQSSYFKAIAPVVSQQTVLMENWIAPRVISVFQVSGLEDGLIPWQGGTSLGHTFMSAQASAENWAAQFNCNLTPITSTAIWGNNMTTSYSYANCDNGQEVTYHLVENAGHDGGIAGDGEYYERIWMFFMSH